MIWRERITRILLWVSVLAWGVLLGGKLFDHVVLAGAWSASPPESLSLLPKAPVILWIPGNISFQAQLPYWFVGVFITGCKTPLQSRVWLFLPAAMLLVTLVFTVYWFWPANGALWRVAKDLPDAIQDRPTILALTRQWMIYDWLRILAGAVGFVSSVRAISIPFPGSNDCHKS